MLKFNFLQFQEILGILPNTVAEEWPQIHYLILPITEIPKWFKFNHHQSVGNSVSFLVGPKFSNLVVCIAFPSKDVNGIEHAPLVDIFINGKEQYTTDTLSPNSNYDTVWLIYGKVNISNPSEENHIEVKVEVWDTHGRRNLSLNRMRIYVECICCPQNASVGIRRRLLRRNLRPTHARRPQKHYLSHFGWLRIRFQLWKRSSKPWRRRITNGFHDQGSS